MSRCNLSHTNLNYCCLERADLQYANLECAQLVSVRGLCANMVRGDGRWNNTSNIIQLTYIYSRREPTCGAVTSRIPLEFELISKE